jgi:Arc/MetJ-type ribon-helix-helix transcriptional regulator
MERAKKVTVTLPPELAAFVDEVCQDGELTASEFVRSVLRWYAEDSNWRAIFAYAELKAKKVGLYGITAEEVAELMYARHVREANG